MVTFKQMAMALAGVLVVAGVGALGYWLGRPGAEEPGASSTQETPSPDTVGRWELQAQFTGPLRDTVVQRWRDPKTGILCYIYLPIIVQHSQPLQNAMVHYGANNTGSISCVRP